MFRLCWHKWSDWSDPVTTLTGCFQQWKVCKKCNKFAFRNLRWHNQTQLNETLKATSKAKEEL